MSGYRESVIDALLSNKQSIARQMGIRFEWNWSYRRGRYRRRISAPYSRLVG